MFRRGPCIPEFDYPIGQDLRLTIETDADAVRHRARTTPATTAPSEHKLNSIRELFEALRACWVPPPAEQAHAGMQMSVRLSFKRTGEIIGTPRVTYSSPDASLELQAIPITRRSRPRSNAARRCRSAPGMGGAIAGRPIAIRFVDNRTLEGAIAMADAENTMILETTKGKVVIADAARPRARPCRAHQGTGAEGFYDGIVFHRVIDGFMAQTGCPQGTGTGGSGKKLKAEFNKEPHVRGTVSMARAQNPDSGDSQFFICFDDARFLNNQYTVWGKVTEGMENVDKIKRGEPVSNPDKIVSATMAADAKK